MLSSHYRRIVEHRDGRRRRVERIDRRHWCVVKGDDRRHGLVAAERCDCLYSRTAMGRDRRHQQATERYGRRRRIAAERRDRGDGRTIDQGPDGRRDDVSVGCLRLKQR